MAKRWFDVTVKESYHRTYKVLARDEQEADDLVNAMVNNGDVEAEDASAAEELAEEMVDSGDIDGVNMKGTLKSGGYERNFSCQGPTPLPVTATKSPRRKREGKEVRRAVARGQ